MSTEKFSFTAQRLSELNIDNSLLDDRLSYLLLLLERAFLEAGLLYRKIDLKEFFEDKAHTYNDHCQLRRNLGISFCRDNARYLLERLDKIPVLLELCETCKELSAEKVGGEKNNQSQNQK